MMNNCRTILRSALALALLVTPIYAGSDSNTRYLALGDSVSFGYYPLPLPPQPSDSYVGYPEILDPLVPKQEVNASCPGQSSASFLNDAVPDIGCEPFKAAGLLHVPYTGSQAGFALSQLKDNKSIDLVTLSIGGNDLSMLELTCQSTTQKAFSDCVKTDLPATLKAYKENLTKILKEIRANYSGTLVMVKYYPVNIDSTFTTAIAALNSRMVQVGNPFGVKFADGFTAFQVASFWTRGDPCKAGLLVRLGPTTCDIHPSRLGQSVLAVTVLAAIAGR